MTAILDELRAAYPGETPAVMVRVEDAKGYKPLTIIVEFGLWGARPGREEDGTRAWGCSSSDVANRVRLVGRVWDWADVEDLHLAPAVSMYGDLLEEEDIELAARQLVRLRKHLGWRAGERCKPALEAINDMARGCTVLMVEDGEWKPVPGLAHIARRLAEVKPKKRGLGD